jgi:hypothetical protein
MMLYPFFSQLALFLSIIGIANFSNHRFDFEIDNILHYPQLVLYNIIFKLPIL